MSYLSTFRLALFAGLLSLCVLLPGVSWAQAPPWALALSGVAAGTANVQSATEAVATDASGNVLVAGYFSGQLTFGTTTLTSTGAADFFLAKYVPATGTWAWAVRGGGSNSDAASGVAVSGTSVYVTGYLHNDASDSYQVTLGGSNAAAGSLGQAGASSTASPDAFVAKYTDNGTSASPVWVQVGGGTGYDAGQSVAVSGTSVYMTGYLTNNASNSSRVLFGGTGGFSGTVVQYGVNPGQATSTILLAKYTDNGPTATLGWTQVGGGTGNDMGTSVAVSGTSVYVTGMAAGGTSSTDQLVFGGTGSTAGTVVQYGATNSYSYDLVLMKYQDNGASATVRWAQVAGGTANDAGQAVAVSGSSVYVTGFIANSLSNGYHVVFGGSGTTAGTRQQLGPAATLSSALVLAKYTDQGATAVPVWTQVGGGNGSYNIGYSVVVSGSTVYVAGSIYNDNFNSSQVVFGGAGTSLGTAPQPGASAMPSSDVVVARYTDNGPTATLAWTQVGGGTRSDTGYGLALSSNWLYVAGSLVPVATFGSLSLTTPASATTNFLASFSTLVLATMPAAATPTLALHPNPAYNAVLSGATPHTPGQVLDALGRLVATFTTDVTGTAQLAPTLAPGVYVVRVGQQAARLAVQ